MTKDLTQTYEDLTQSTSELEPPSLPFPEVWDSTMIRDLRSCPRKFFYSRMLGLTPNLTNINLHAGKVYARGQEVFRLAFYGEGLDVPRALYRATIEMIREWGEEDPMEFEQKSLWNTILALEASFSEYPPGQDYIKPAVIDGRPAVEFNFVQAIPGTQHPETGQPILYTGRFDMLANFQEQLYVEDDKTAKALGPTWPKQWELRSQFTSYCWGAQSYGYPVVGAIIRGTGMLKSKFTFMQTIKQVSQWEIDRWLEQTRRDISRAQQMWESGYWDYNLDESCAHYGGCAYMKLCTKPNPERWIEPDYRIEFWDPLAVTKAEIPQ